MSTNARIFERPLSIDQAAAYVDEWMEQPPVDFVAPGLGHWPILRNLIEATGTGGNLTTDAHIAALALEHGYTVYSADNDFQRFAGIKYVNRLERA